MTGWRRMAPALCAALVVLPVTAAAAPAASPPAPAPSLLPAPPFASAPLPFRRAPRWTDPEPERRKSRPLGGGTTEARVVSLVNRHRERAGCPPVRLRPELDRAARAHSGDMARRHRLTHEGADGGSPADRLRAAGYHPEYSAEDIAAGPAGARAVVDVWMDSPPHRTALLTCHYTHAGVGVTKGPGGPWWTLDLATGH